MICPKIPAPGIPNGAAIIARPFNPLTISRQGKQTNHISYPSIRPILF